MNISSGKIELNGISFGSDTSVDELIGNPQFRSYINNGGPVNIFTSQQVAVDRYTFNIKIFFINCFYRIWEKFCGFCIPSQSMK